MIRYNRLYLILGTGREIWLAHRAVTMNDMKNFADISTWIQQCKHVHL